MARGTATGGDRIANFGQHAERTGTMLNSSATPSITVAIGRQARVFHAFVTTAPAALDAPSTVTLYAAGLADVSGLAAEPLRFEAIRAPIPARLVLIDAVEFTWQRARYREAQHLLAAADPVLVGLNTLQHWLWHRLKTGAASDPYTERVS